MGNENIIVRSQKYKESQYQYYAKSDKPFVSKGGHTVMPMVDLLLRNVLFRLMSLQMKSQESLGVFIVKQSALLNVTGTYFTVKLKAEV